MHEGLPQAQRRGHGQLPRGGGPALSGKFSSAAWQTTESGSKKKVAIIGGGAINAIDLPRANQCQKW